MALLLNVNTTLVIGPFVEISECGDFVLGCVVRRADFLKIKDDLANPGRDYD